MKRLLATLLLLAIPTLVQASEPQRVIVRNENGLLSMKAVCKLLGCSVVRQLDGTLGQLFLLDPPKLINLNVFLSTLRTLSGIVHVELDLSLLLEQPSGTGPIPAGLWDRNPVEYFGASVWNGYANQPAAQIVRAAEARNQFGVTGAGTVAVIDTGVSKHPALLEVLVPGYDFTQNVAGTPEEEGGVQYRQSTAAVLDGTEPAIVNQSTAAVLDDDLLGILATPSYAAFGHGTMVSGVIHMGAPTARIMPLKAFGLDGTGTLSNILRAIYYATDSQVNVINMSFSFTSPSEELQRALDNARHHGLIAVAAAGNYGTDAPVYPAAYGSSVIDVASTDDWDRRSSFSNYGPAIWVAAPGEAVISAYPFGTYSASWGTSFSAPMVSAAVSLLLNVKPSAKFDEIAEAIGHAVWISDELGHGRLDIYTAVGALEQ